MSESLFETPEKTAFRELAMVALDQAGFVLEDELRVVSLPAEFGRDATIKGDIQAVEEDDTLVAFYLRMDSKALPTWIANAARGAHAVGGARVEVVVTQSSTKLESSCKRAGAGLFVVQADGSLQHVVDAGSFDQDALEEQLKIRVLDIRYRLDSKVKLNRSAIVDDFSKVKRLTRKLPREERNERLEHLELRDAAWTRWGADREAEIDKAEADADERALEVIEARMLEDPPGAA